MYIATWTMVAGVIVLLTASETVPGAGRQVLVCLDARGVVPGSVQLAAKAHSSAIYEKIGIDLKWERPAACADGGIAIDVREDAVKGASPMALAHALPFGTGPQRITVFYNRVKNVIRFEELSAGAILGHILAHEIGHVLMATNSHSTTGLMQAQWSGMEISSMSFAPLGFSEEEAQTIRRRLDSGNLTASRR
jgi:hypothetical protein